MATASAETMERIRNSPTGRMMAALDTVQFNSQAIVAATRCLGAAALARTSLEKFPFDPAAVAAAEQVREVAEDVWRYAKPFRGITVDAPVSVPSWTELRKAIQRCYGLLFAIDKALPEQVRETFASAALTIAEESAKAIPKVIKAALDLAKDAADPILDLPSDLLWKILKKYWWVIGGALALVAGAVYLAVNTNTGRTATRAAASRGLL